VITNFSSGGTKISAAVSASNQVTQTTAGTTTVTVYTAPANAYALVNLNYYCTATAGASQSAQATILIGNVNFSAAYASGVTSSNGTVNVPLVSSGVVVGPGQSVQVRGFVSAGTNNATAFCSISGLEFTNA
jgi:hypothetical protein